jgi:transcriptional regulator with XRE-family HTH domain
MTLSIGENIKRLRTEREITQENLARHLGVTSRAVSKWEVGRAYPDITLLPGLASYFGVSLDELMSMDAERQTQRANEMMAQATSNQALGKIAENIKYLRKAVQQFPGDYRFQVMLSSMLVAEYATEHDSLTERDGDRPEIRENYLEAAEYLERVLKQGRLSALHGKACAYDGVRVSERAG